MAPKIESFIPESFGVSSRIGSLRTMHAVDGGAGGSKSKDDDDDDEDEDDDDEDDDEDANKSEDELRAELKAVRSQLSKASGSSKTKRDKIRRLEKELADAAASKSGKSKDDDDDEKPDLDAIRKAAKAEALAEANETRKADKTEAALARAGVNPERLATALKFVNLDDIDLNDDGTLDGIDEAIEALKKDTPELFATKRRKRESVSGSDGDGKGGGSGKKSATQLQAEQLRGRAS